MFVFLSTCTLNWTAQEVHKRWNILDPLSDFRLSLYQMFVFLFLICCQTIPGETGGYSPRRSWRECEGFDHQVVELSFWSQHVSFSDMYVAMGDGFGLFIQTLNNG